MEKVICIEVRAIFLFAKKNEKVVGGIFSCHRVDQEFTKELKESLSVEILKPFL